MKKLLSITLLSLLLTGCEDSPTTEQQPVTQPEQSQNTETVEKAIKIEDFIKDIPFSKNEKGTVIFNSAVEMFSQFSEYDLEDKNIKVVSENPLHIQLFPDVIQMDEENMLKDIRYAFIRGLYNIFTYTNIDNFTLEVLPIDTKTRKALNKKFNLKAKISREQALKILQTFSAAKSFDDLVNFDSEDKYNVIGYSPSKLSSQFANSQYADKIVKALSTGKIEIPTEEVVIPLNFDLSVIKNKLSQLDMNDWVDSRNLNDGKKAFSIKLDSVVMIEAIGNTQENIDYLSLQFGMVNDPNIILNTLAGLGVTALATPDPDKTFKEINTMIESAGKRMKKEDTIKIKKEVDGITLELKVFKSMGGLSYLTYKKLETRPVKFTEE